MPVSRISTIFAFKHYCVDSSFHNLALSCCLPPHLFCFLIIDNKFNNPHITGRSVHWTIHTVPTSSSLPLKNDICKWVLYVHDITRATTDTIATCISQQRQKLHLIENRKTTSIITAFKPAEMLMEADRTFREICKD